VVEDVQWAGSRIAGEGFSYPGEVVLLFGSRDRVVRWQDLLPGGTGESDTTDGVLAVARGLFPRAERVEVVVMEGGHLVPESDAGTCMRQVLGLLGQLDEG
jgi:hypothetical protein